MTMKTLFLNPPSFEGFDGGAGSRYQAKREIRSFWYPTWLAQPAALLPGSKLIDAPARGLTLADILPLAGDYDLAILHTSTPSFAADVKVAEALKQANPRLMIGFVGAHVGAEDVVVLVTQRVREGANQRFLLRARHVRITPQHGFAAAMRKTMRATKAALASGRHVVIFPEGTRAPPGVVLPFRPGIAALYLHCHVPVIPVAIDSGWFWGKNRLLKRPGHITVRFLPPLPAGLGKDEMMGRLQADITEAARSLPGNRAAAG